MAKTDAYLINAMAEVTQAMIKLSAAWEDVNEEQRAALSNDAYPFPEGFDDVITKVVDWANATRDALGAEF